MKNLLLLALLAGATAAEAAPASVTKTSQDQNPPSKKEMKMKRKARKQNGPEVYKGTVAEQNRIVNDAPGSEKDDDGDGATRKNGKPARSKKQ